MNTSDLNTGNNILKDLKINSSINNNSKDNYLKEIYKNKPTENTLDYNLNVNSLYRNRYNLHYKNKILDECICNPQYNYEGSGREPQYFTTGLIRTGLNYSTPPLERTSSRY